MHANGWKKGVDTVYHNEPRKPPLSTRRVVTKRSVPYVSTAINRFGIFSLPQNAHLLRGENDNRERLLLRGS